MIKFNKPVPQNGRAVELGDRVTVNGADYLVTDHLYESSITGSRVFRAAQYGADNCIVLKDTETRNSDDLDRVMELRERLSEIETDYLTRYLAYVNYIRGRVVIAANFADGISLDRLTLKRDGESEDVRLINAIFLTRGLVTVVGKLMDAGALHRDLKPRNGILLRNGKVGLKVGLLDIDFLTTVAAEEINRQAARGLDEASIPMVGTHENISPEAIGRAERVKEEDKDKYPGKEYIFKGKRFSRTSDMYGVGITAMRLLGDPVDQIVGKRFSKFNEKPDAVLAARSIGRFFPDDLKDRLYGEVLPKYSDEVFLQARGMIEFILAATQHNPDDRPQTGEDALRILDGR